jgi:hypothetical protein
MGEKVVEESSMALLETAQSIRDTEQSKEQIARIANSTFLRNAPVLQRLLRYLSTCALEGTEGDLKECVIGVEVFDRRPGYDPKTDTIVRVQAHRLRGKLRQYYETEGAADLILIDIPKGHYLLAFDRREMPEASALLQDEPTSLTGESSELNSPDIAWPEESVLAADAASARTTAAKPGPRHLGMAVLFLAGGLAGGLATFAIGHWISKSHPSVIATSDDPAPSVRAFWNAFLDGDSEPILVYPDATFLLDKTNDLFRYPQGAVDNRGALVDAHLAKTLASNPDGVAKAGSLFYDDGYTGTGELESVAIIARLCTQLGAHLSVRRGRDLTVDDLKHHNVILLGSSSQNEAVGEFSLAGDFRFIDPDGPIESWHARIQDLHPAPSEPPYYQTERNAPRGGLTADYALMSLQPGIEGRHRILVLGGLDTEGTKGATMFITSASGLDSLARSVNKPSSAQAPPMSPFQSIIKVDLQNGRDVLGIHLLATHLIAAH